MRGPHLQTLAAYWFKGAHHPYRATQVHVQLDDGDSVVLHDDCPSDWAPGSKVALLSHGLAGCHQSPYMIRIAAKLNHHGVRTFRLDLRGCGAGSAFARNPYHSGRSNDLTAALAAINARCQMSPLVLVGFSLSGNIALKLASEWASNPPSNVRSVIAVCPPINLAVCVEEMQTARNRLYDRYFVNLLIERVEERRRLFPDADSPTFPRRPRTVFEFDDFFTAPVCGFGNAANYYTTCSALPLLSRIDVPTKVLAARDDPMIPFRIFDAAAWSKSTELIAPRHGGHLGFLARRGVDPDRRWMDWRVVEWVLQA